MADLPPSADGLRAAEAVYAAMLQDSQQVWSEHAHGRMSWRCWGEGPPLLLLHGNFGSWSHWIRNLPALAPRRRVIAPDLPGFGESDGPPKDSSPEDVTRMLIEGLPAVLRADEPFEVAGFSMGCRFAGPLARDLPDRVRRAVLFAPGGLALPMAPLPSLERLRPGLPRADLLALHRRNLGRVMVSGPDAVDDLAVYLQDRNVADTRFRPHFRGRDNGLRDALFGIRCPLEGVWGEADRYVGEHMAVRRELLAALPGPARFHLVPGAGHWVPYEAPLPSNALLLGEAS